MPSMNGELDPQSQLDPELLTEVMTSIESFDSSRADYVKAFASYRSKTNEKNREYINESGLVLTADYKKTVEFIFDNEPDNFNKASQIMSLLIGERNERVTFLKSLVTCEHGDDDDMVEEIESIREELYEGLENGEDKSTVSRKITDNFINFQNEDMSHFLFHIEDYKDMLPQNKRVRIAKNIGSSALRISEIGVAVAIGLSIYTAISRH